MTLMRQPAPTVLILPGWQGSGPGHWQWHWARLHGHVVVEQNDWMRPLRGDWLARLDEAVIDAPGPVVLVAHSLACVLVAAWAAVSRHTARVRGALLVAPGNTEDLELSDRLPGWSPIVRQALPFKSIFSLGRSSSAHDLMVIFSIINYFLIEFKKIVSIKQKRPQ